jgi:hypothetical protein
MHVILRLAALRFLAAPIASIARHKIASDVSYPFVVSRASRNLSTMAAQH